MAVGLSLVIYGCQFRIQQFGECVYFGCIAQAKYMLDLAFGDQVELAAVSLCQPFNALEQISYRLGVVMRRWYFHNNGRNVMLPDIALIHTDDHMQLGF